MPSAPASLRRTGELHGVRDRTTGAGEDRHPPAGGGDRRGHHVVVLGHVQGVELPGAAGGEHPARFGRDAASDVLGQSGVVHLTVRAEGRDREEQHSVEHPTPSLTGRPCVAAEGRPG